MAKARRAMWLAVVFVVTFTYTSRADAHDKEGHQSVHLKLAKDDDARKNESSHKEGHQSVHLKLAKDDDARKNESSHKGRHIPVHHVHHKRGNHSKPKEKESGCSKVFQIPADVPKLVTQHNGVELPPVCIDSAGRHTVYAIGDWGGIVYAPLMPPVPADKRSKLFPKFQRKFIKGVDDRAQLRVAAEMRALAASFPPDYILNVGDNFYWGGVDGHCGGEPYQEAASQQWENVFEKVYWGPGLENAPWLSVLGNHDYGGYKFTAAWEQTVGYTWGGGKSTGRWINPCLYYAQRVNYPGFSVDYLFVDSNAFEAWTPEMNPSHNICGLAHSGKEASCGEQGPGSIWECHAWFQDIWYKQLDWMQKRLEATTSTFQVIVTHFPPKWGIQDWTCLAERYGIDLFIAGHIHRQRMYAPQDERNDLKGTCVVVTGGGGGITSEAPPRVDGDDDAYGFVRMDLSSKEIVLHAISHGGVTRSITHCPPRYAVPGPKCETIV